MEWIKTTDRLPRREDANAAGEVLIRARAGDPVERCKFSLVSRLLVEWAALGTEDAGNERAEGPRSGDGTGEGGPDVG